MVCISQKGLKVSQALIEQLKVKGIDVPEKAYRYDHVYTPKFNNLTEIYTFKDGHDLRMRQYKRKVDKKTFEVETQIRDYEYTKRFYGKGKLTEVDQKTITPDGKETSIKWFFYHPKDGSAVRFSQKGDCTEKNNFLHSDGAITDKNGLKIRPISRAEYLSKRKELDDKHFVDEPWTTFQSITTKDRCGTDSVQECTVVGIYGDNGISLNHLNPNNPVNSNFDDIEKLLYRQMKQQGENAKAFVIGSCESDYNSNRMYEGIIDFLSTEKVNHSRFKTGDKVLYGPFKKDSAVCFKDAKKYKYGLASGLEWQSGQHLIYDNGEVQIANSVIDSELKKGNTDPEKLIKKSFYHIYK